MKKQYNCIDSGSEFCPCDLADTLDCISCSHLRGEDFCDCNWNGVCILYEYYMNNMKSRGSRSVYDGLVIDKSEIEEDLFLLKIKTEEDLVEELNNTGSYVFINKSNNPHYNAPMSVLDIDGDSIYIVYYEMGPKTKGIKKGEKLNIKGPYWNGIIGKTKLSEVKNSSILIYARGIGQSAIVIPIKKLKNKNNEIFLFLDKGKTESLYCLKFIKDFSLEIKEINLFTELGKEILLHFIKTHPIDIVISAGAEMAHREIKSLLDELESQVEWFTTNNNILCCGEGICGSCIRKTNNGDRVKTCKTIIDPVNFY